MRRLAFAAGWAAVAACGLELTAREVARRPLLPASPAFTPWILVIVACLAGAVAYLAQRRERRRGTALLFAVLFTAGVALQLQLNARLQSDGFYYYAYLRSLAFDRDVNFINDYRMLGLSDKPHLFNLTETGHAHSAWTIGPAILWAPFFAGGHVVATYVSATRPDITTNGISYPYRQAVCVAGLFYGLLGCYFMYRIAARFHARGQAVAAVILVVTGSFMLWYLVKEPSMTHAPSMAVVAAFVWMWLSTQGGRTRTQWMLLGALAGLMTLVRWQNALFAILPFCDWLSAMWTSRRGGDRSQAMAMLGNGVLFALAATVVFLPQMFAWNAIYGRWLAVSPVGPQIRLGDPHLVDILWSARNGLFSTSPVLYIAAIGLLVFAATVPRVGVPVVLAVALMTYFNASIQDWWGSDGFGGRRFDGTLPLFALGMAVAIERGIALVRRAPAVAVAAAGVVLVLWNLTLMSAANAGTWRIGEPVSFGTAMAAQARAFHAWFGNPFTYPASLGFALWNGVSPARYDLLSATRFLGDPLRPYGRIDIGSEDEWLIGEGWHARETEGPTSFRWSGAASTILVPLDRAAPLRVQLRAHAFGHPSAPDQSVTLRINGTAFGPLPVPPGWHTIEADIPQDAWRTGVNTVALEFAWERRPADVGLGGDTRSLAAAVDFLRVAIVN